MIDLELACAVDPAGKCFDLEGPASGVPVAPQHVAQGEPYASNGVWWDSPIEGMGRIFWTAQNHVTEMPPSAGTRCWSATLRHHRDTHL